VRFELVEIDMVPSLAGLQAQAVGIEGVDKERAGVLGSFDGQPLRSQAISAARAAMASTRACRTIRRPGMLEASS